jgi:hypothetical protein
MTNTSEGSAKRIATMKTLHGEDIYAQFGAKGGAKSKGRKHSAETKRKISETKKRRHLENLKASS